MLHFHFTSQAPTQHALPCPVCASSHGWPAAVPLSRCHHYQHTDNRLPSPRPQTAATATAVAAAAGRSSWRLAVGGSQIPLLHGT